MAPVRIEQRKWPRASAEIRQYFAQNAFSYLPFNHKTVGLEQSGAVCHERGSGEDITGTAIPSGGRQFDLAAVFYLTDSEFTTGAVLPVDGGMSSGK
jgi:hypothetical protein